MVSKSIMSQVKQYRIGLYGRDKILGVHHFDHPGLSTAYVFLIIKRGCANWKVFNNKLHVEVKAQLKSLMKLICKTKPLCQTVLLRRFPEVPSSQKHAWVYLMFSARSLLIQAHHSLHAILRGTANLVYIPATPLL